MNDYNRNMLDGISKLSGNAFEMRIKEIPNNMYKPQSRNNSKNNNIEIQRCNLTNIFEENSYLLQIRRAFEYQNDHLSAIHCTNIIDKLPILCDFELYRLHLKWFHDDFIVYATDRPSDILFVRSEYLQRLIQDQLQIHIVGLIESPL